MSKEEQVLSYLYDKIFLEVINSKTASKKANNILKQEGFTTFQDIIEEFKIKFDDNFIKD